MKPRPMEDEKQREGQIDKQGGVGQCFRREGHAKIVAESVANECLVIV